MAGIPEYVIDQVRERTDIVEVISRRIPLRKAGRNYKAPCPFHHEKTPSFMVSPAKQIFHCFGCGAGGNVFSFLMKYERLEFPEAVRELAKAAGVAVPETARSRDGRGSLAERLHAINDAAAAFYAESLARSASGAIRDYIKKRKIDPGTVREFKIGYAPKSWNALLSFLKGKGYEDGLLERSGLVIRGREGRAFDRFRDRMIFPICDTKGGVKGFGSRVLDESQPKYMNSPETFIYNKGNHLYGLNLSWEEIRDKNSAVVVEGYIDFLTPFQRGVRNLAATLGTALTVEQIRLLKRYTNNVTILFDADQAGQNAAIRSLDLLVSEEIKVKVAELPKGEDPDSFVNSRGPDVFRGLVDDAQDLFDYKLGVLMARCDAKDLEGKARIASEMLPLISRMKNAILQSGYIKRLAETLSVSEADLKKELGKVRPDYTYNYRPAPHQQQAGPSRSHMAEKILAGLMLEDASAVKTVQGSLICENFRNLSIRKIVERLFEFSNEQREISPSKLIDCFKGEDDICACISELIAASENLVDKKKNLEDCIQWVRESDLKESLRGLCGEIKAAQEEGDDSRVVELVVRYNSMMKEAKAHNA